MAGKKVSFNTPAPAPPADEYVGSKSKKGLRLTVDLTVELHREFKALAGARGTTMREMIRAYVEQEVTNAKR